MPQVNIDPSSHDMQYWQLFPWLRILIENQRLRCTFILHTYEWQQKWTLGIIPDAALTPKRLAQPFHFCRDAGERGNYGSIASLPFHKGTKVPFRNSITGHFMVYKDWLETNVLQLFAHPENSEWFFFYFCYYCLGQRCSRTETSVIGNDFLIFISFHCPQLFHCPRCRVAVPASLNYCPNVHHTFGVGSCSHKQHWKSCVLQCGWNGKRFPKRFGCCCNRHSAFNRCQPFHGKCRINCWLGAVASCSTTIS